MAREQDYSVCFNLPLSQVNKGFSLIHSVGLQRLPIAETVLTMIKSPCRSSSVPAHGAKQSRIENSLGSLDRSNRLNDLFKHEQMPEYMKIIVDIMLETKEQLREISRMNRELADEVKSLRVENDFLEEKVQDLSNPQQITTHVSQDCSAESSPVSPPPEDSEMPCSVVISGIRESTAPSSFERVNHDYICVNSILDFLGVECFPRSLYRMGRPSSTHYRLLKVVLPCSRSQRELLKHAPRLRFFSEKGIYIRPSLPLQERIRLREKRLKAKQVLVSQNCTPPNDTNLSPACDSSMNNVSLQNLPGQGNPEPGN